MHKQRQATRSLKGPARTEFKPAGQFTHRHSRAERREMGKKLRDACPRKAHAVWD